MKYYYIPTTYRGRKFGKGLRGGSNTFQKAAAVGNALASKKVNPAAILKNIPPKDAKKAMEIIAKGESTGKPQEITKKQLGLWGSIKHDAAMVKKKWDDLSPTTKKIIKYTLAGLAGTYAGKKLIYDPRMRRMKEQYEKDLNVTKMKFHKKMEDAEKKFEEEKENLFAENLEEKLKREEEFNKIHDNYQREYEERDRRTKEAEKKSRDLENENKLLRERHNNEINEQKRIQELKYNYPNTKEEKEEIKKLTNEEIKKARTDELNAILKRNNWSLVHSKKDGIAEYERVYGPLDPRLDKDLYLIDKIPGIDLNGTDFSPIAIQQIEKTDLEGNHYKGRFIRKKGDKKWTVTPWRSDIHYDDPGTLVYTGTKAGQDGVFYTNLPINATKAVENIANLKAPDLRRMGFYYDRTKNYWLKARKPSVKKEDKLYVYPEKEDDPDYPYHFEFVDPDEEDLYGEQKKCYSNKGKLSNWLNGCGYGKRKTYKKRTNNLKKKFHII